MTDSLELDFLRYADLPELVGFGQTDRGYFYTAALTTGTASIAPQYRVANAEGAVIGHIVLPSQLPNVELYLLEWMLAYDIRHAVRTADHPWS